MVNLVPLFEGTADHITPPNSPPPSSPSPNTKRTWSAENAHAAVAAAAVSPTAAATTSGAQNRWAQPALLRAPPATAEPGLWPQPAGPPPLLIVGGCAALCVLLWMLVSFLG